MKEEYTAAEYVNAFRQLVMPPHHMRMLQANYHAPNRTITATMMAKAMGYPNYNTANLHYGKLGRLLAEQLGWNPLPQQTVFVIVTFEKPEKEWHWIMRSAISSALEQLGWVDGDNFNIPEELVVTKPLYEGAIKTISVNAYERSSVARNQCILHYGCRCSACDLSLAEKYGEVAQGRIHVHHLRQLADINSEYYVDPIRDLRPVCPTCHAVIHTRTPPFTIEEVQAMIKVQKQ